MQKKNGGHPPFFEREIFLFNREEDLAVSGHGPIFGRGERFHGVGAFAQLFHHGDHLVLVSHGFFLHVRRPFRLFRRALQVRRLLVSFGDEGGELVDEVCLRAEVGGGAGGNGGVDALGEIFDVFIHGGYDVAHDHLLHGHGFDMQDLAIIVQEDLRARDHFFFREDAVAGEEVDVFARLEEGHRLGRAAQIEQSASLRLGDPFGRIVVAVEDDAAVLGERVLDYRRDLVHDVALGGV